MNNYNNGDLTIFPLIKFQEIKAFLTELIYYSSFGICIVECNENLLSKLLSISKNHEFIIIINGKVKLEEINLINENKFSIIIDSYNELIESFINKEIVIIRVISSIVKTIDDYINKGYTNYLILNTEGNRNLVNNYFMSSITVIFSADITDSTYISSLQCPLLSKISLSFNNFSIGRFFLMVLESFNSFDSFLFIIFNNQGILLDTFQVKDIEMAMSILNKKIILIYGYSYEITKIRISNNKKSLLIYIDYENFDQMPKFSFMEYDPNIGGLKYLQNILKIRQKSKDYTSYSYKLLSDTNKIKTKLLEEANELICSEIKEEIIHECADFFYFITLNLQSNFIDVSEVEKYYFKNLRYKTESLIESKSYNFFKIAIYDIQEQNNIEFLSKTFNFSLENFSFNDSTSNDKIIKIIKISRNDLNSIISRKLVDSIICFQYEIEDFIHEFHSIPLNQSITTSLVIYSNIFKDLDELKKLNTKRKIILMTNLLNVANKWIRKHNFKVKVVSISDNHFEYLKENLCDIVLIQKEDIEDTLNLNIIDVYSIYEKKIFVDINKLHILNTNESNK